MPSSEAQRPCEIDSLVVEHAIYELRTELLLTLEALRVVSEIRPRSTLLLPVGSQPSRLAPYRRALVSHFRLFLEWGLVFRT